MQGVPFKEIKLGTTQKQWNIMYRKLLLEIRNTQFFIIILIITAHQEISVS